MTDPYRIRSPETWVQARDDYLAGMDAETVCRRHDLGLSAFRRRARKYGWRRRDQYDPTPNEVDLEIYADIDMDDQVDTARLRFVKALSHGKATEALRWRRLWHALRDERNAFNADFFSDMTPDEIQAFHAAPHPDDDDSEEVTRLLGATTAEARPQLLGEPSPPAPAPMENVHDVHSIFSGVHISEAERPSKRAARRRRGREVNAAVSPRSGGP